MQSFSRFQCDEVCEPATSIIRTHFFQRSSCPSPPKRSRLSRASPDPSPGTRRRHGGERRGAGTEHAAPASALRSWQRRPLRYVSCPWTGLISAPLSGRCQPWSMPQGLPKPGANLPRCKRLGTWQRGRPILQNLSNDSGDQQSVG